MFSFQYAIAFGSGQPVRENSGSGVRSEFAVVEFGGVEPRTRSVEPAWKTISTERSAASAVIVVDIRCTDSASQPFVFARSFVGWEKNSVSSWPGAFPPTK